MPESAAWSPLREPHRDRIQRPAIVVTGASTGIGEACALHLSSVGCHVFAGVRKEVDAERLRLASPNVTPLVFDVRDDQAVREAATFVAGKVGTTGIQGLVNNAGVAVAGPLEYLPLSDLRMQFEVNLVGQIGVTQAFLPLIRHGKGRIVFIGSVSGLVATPMVGAYCGSKSALEALADSLRLELAEWGIHVSVIEPGQTATAIWRTSVESADERASRMPPAAVERYGWMERAMRVTAARGTTHGLPPLKVARTVERSLLGPSPKSRYVVGREALVVKILAHLPGRLRDKLILSQLRQRAAAQRERR